MPLTLFIQPTYQCALECKGCYVKESRQRAEISTDTLTSLIRYLWVTEKLNIAQVTLAVDDIPNDEVAKAKMVQALSTALRMRKLYAGIEFHITINSLHTLQKYVDSGLPLQYIASHSDLISVSHLGRRDIPQLRYIRSLTRVNYNYMHHGQTSLYREMLEHVDQSYYLLFKTGLGRKNSREAIDVFKQGLREISVWNPEEKRKIKVDGCVQDAYKFLQTGFGCSSNISRFHIWPDGHITGCAYNKEGGTPAHSLSAILQELSRASSTYEFRSCKIPQEYSSSSSSRLSVI